ATTGAIVALLVVILGWFSGLFKWMWTRVFGGKDRRSESDPQALTKALHRYEELIETKDTLREAEEKVKDLSAALELTQSIARGGGELAKKAQALLDVFVAQPDDPTLPAQFDGLIDDYENGPVNDLIALYLGRGAVSYMNDTRGALAAYTRVTQLNQDHKEAHNQCGILHSRLGDLTAAQAAYDTVLTLAEAEKDDEFKAKALGNLGILAQTRGDLAAAEGYYAQSLTLNQELGRKEGMANNYGNLGRLEHARGNMAGARAFWGQARDLYAEIGMRHRVAQLQGWIDSLDG
ncbi:MAG: tetratricopeptide repeat protein, partial [Paracoccaceae bacterium]